MHWHQWGNWVELNDSPRYIIVQVRTCSKCKKIKVRKVKLI